MTYDLQQNHRAIKFDALELIGSRLMLTLIMITPFKQNEKKKHLVLI
jgi:hypothetical protein